MSSLARQSFLSTVKKLKGTTSNTHSSRQQLITTCPLRVSKLFDPTGTGGSHHVLLNNVVASGRFSPLSLLLSGVRGKVVSLADTMVDGCATLE